MADCYPALEKLASLKVPLEPGEAHLVAFLSETLDDEYEIFVQPFFNGDRPDIVLVRRDAGALIIEVKDWDLSGYAYEDKKTWRLVTDGVPILSPVEQVEKYKWNLFNLHVGQLLEKKIENSKSAKLVSTAVYFHHASEADARKKCEKPPNTHVLGGDSLTRERWVRLLRDCWLHRRSQYWDDELYRALRRYLVPPSHTEEEGKPIVYRGKQKQLVESRAGVQQKIRGVAGCGKTHVLAGRAVRAHARTNSTVLVLTFNLTLRNYIRDRISEVRLRFKWDAFYISNYHEFFKSTATNLCLAMPEAFFEACSDEDFFAPAEHLTPRYPAIFVDEVQDYETAWLRTLKRYFLTPDGEFVVFGDEKQNVYGQKLDEERRPNTTIPGRWNELTDSFRLNAGLVGLAQAFQRSVYGDKYVFDDEISLVQSDLFHAPPLITYGHRPGMTAAKLFELIQGLAERLGIHPNDLTIVSPLIDVLRDLDDYFRRVAGEKTTRTFETNEERKLLAGRHGEDSQAFDREVNDIRRGRKRQFEMKAGTVKLSTIHSFKGWEGHTVVVVLGENAERHEEAWTTDELLYTAITRARQNLVVIDTGNGRYSDFFDANAVPLRL
ncbi:NERD domain-containing protein [Cystobacter fuscus]|uniref:nuclease-related domain-containing DEAD/DEAH box helicase n=1 Tax=Cystobacter fuscus TaxID=43 RepID=UPI002B28B30C|nr:AAA family ATPase [Cystobacter fuscus]